MASKCIIYSPNHFTFQTFLERERDKCIIYVTSLGVVRRTIQRCCNIRKILRNLCVRWVAASRCSSEKYNWLLMKKSNTQISIYKYLAIIFLLLWSDYVSVEEPLNIWTLPGQTSVSRCQNITAASYFNFPTLSEFVSAITLCVQFINFNVTISIGFIG